MALNLIIVFKEKLMTIKLFKKEKKEKKEKEDARKITQVINCSIAHNV